MLSLLRHFPTHLHTVVVAQQTRQGAVETSNLGDSGEQFVGIKEHVQRTHADR